MFIAILTYKKPLEEVDRYLQAHRDYLSEHYAAGDFIMSGPQTPRVGGVIVMRAENRSVVDRIIAQDPFKANGIADYQIVEFTPTMSCDALLSNILNKD
ncbi:MAG: YciI family protein [Muribaculaceae bacterium]|nr:YciI family protein [Muribaculaceae bacterium]